MAGKGRKNKQVTHPQEAQGWFPALVFGGLRWALILAIWGGLALGGLIVWASWGLPEIDDVALLNKRPAITVLDRNGNQIARMGDLYGVTLSVDDVPAHLTGAILAIEDRRFYRHFGLDPLGLARAALANMRAGGVVQGGSTITQQLAKNLFLTNERSMARKLEEAVLALWLELKYDKDEILSAYMNRVYLGAGAWGFEAAARTYYGKSAREVTPGEAAILAGLLKAPSSYSPRLSPARAKARGDVVMRAMYETGRITRLELDEFLALPPAPRRKPGSGSGARWFADWVAAEVEGFIGPVNRDITILTTLDPETQRAAERAVERALDAHGAARNISQAALVAMQPDGAVRAMVGGRNWHESQFNRAVQARRQPGSAFKPVVWLTAVEEGWLPSDRIDASPVAIDGWAPGNFNGEQFGRITLREGLEKSVNTAAVRLLERVGVARSIRTARKLGLKGDLPQDLSLALGTGNASLLEMTGMLASFANGGYGVIPYGITEVHGSDGGLIWRRAGSGPGRVITVKALARLNSMLGDVVETGTGRTANPGIPGMALAGKTGTSQGYRDALFTGFSGHMAVSVWLGNDDNAPMKRVTGGSVPAAIWRDFINETHRGLEPKALVGLGISDSLVEGDPAIAARQTGQPQKARRFEREVEAEDVPILSDLARFFRRVSGEDG